jgi:phosphate transport system protein
MIAVCERLVARGSDRGDIHCSGSEATLTGLEEGAMNLFARDMERLNVATLKLAALVEEMIRGSVRSLCDSRPDLAEQVFAGERRVDRLEVGIEEACLRLLVRHDPVAGDLRRVVAILKVNQELERMADLAAGIARRALVLAQACLAVPIPGDMNAMADLAAEMVRGALDALVEADTDRAREVIALDDEVDRLHRGIIRTLKRTMSGGDERLDAGLHLFSSAVHLERIADHATNIAENVVYMREGVIIRHGDTAHRTTEGSTCLRAARRPRRACLTIQKPPSVKSNKL